MGFVDHIGLTRRALHLIILSTLPNIRILSVVYNGLTIKAHRRLWIKLSSVVFLTLPCHAVGDLILLLPVVSIEEVILIIMAPRLSSLLIL